MGDPNPPACPHRDGGWCFAPARAVRLAAIADELVGLRRQRAEIDARIEAVGDGLSEVEFAAVEALQKACGS